MSAIRRSNLSLRGISSGFVCVFGLLVLGNSVALLGTSRMASQAGRRVTESVHATDATEELERKLREHHRVGMMWADTGEPDLGVYHQEVTSDVLELLEEVPARASDDTRSALRAELARRVDAYLTAWQGIDAHQTTARQIARALRPAFEAVLVASSELRKQTEARRMQSQTAAEEALRTQSLVALASAFLLLVSLALVAFGVRRLLLRPILGLQSAVRSFRDSSPTDKASGGLLRETRELAERFNEMAEAITRQRQDQLTFIAAVAHDLRGPLTTIKSAGQILERDPSRATPQLVQRLNRQLDALTRMVGDLLDAARIEAGQLELQSEEIDLRDVARAMVELYAPTTTRHQLTFRAPDEPVLVHGDAVRLEQVVGNLLSNAIKYSPEGGAVAVSLLASDTEAELSVTDQGIGIHPGELPHLFQPFRRRPSSAQIASGVGLGLSIVRRIVAAHGGRVDVRSTPGAGSTFSVHLPLGLPDRPARHEEPREGRQGSQGNSRGLDSDARASISASSSQLARARGSVGSISSARRSARRASLV